MCKVKKVKRKGTKKCRPKKELELRNKEKASDKKQFDNEASDRCENTTS